MMAPLATLASVPEMAMNVKSCETCDGVSCHCEMANTCSVSPMKRGAIVSAACQRAERARQGTQAGALLAAHVSATQPSSRPGGGVRSGKGR